LFFFWLISITNLSASVWQTCKAKASRLPVVIPAKICRDEHLTGCNEPTANSQLRRFIQGYGLQLLIRQQTTSLHGPVQPNSLRRPHVSDCG
jgi:hypothetical protein